MRDRQLDLRDHTKDRTPLWQSPRFTLRKSISRIKRLRADLPLSIGRRVFRSGTTAQSSMARITQPLLACLPKHGANFSAIKRRPLFSRFSPTKTCAGCARRLRQLLIQLYCPGFAATAPRRLKNLQKFFNTCVGQALRLPATPKAFGVVLQFPSLLLSAKRSIARARDQIQF